MTEPITAHFLSRIDRSVADNLADIRKSFDEDAGIVKDFIVFVSKNMKKDLFGYTRFTLQDFCKESGRNRQDLASLHPHFVKNPKAIIPEHFGHKFSTHFDYALYSMLQKNIIFSKAYESNGKDEAIHLKNFPILKDIKVNVDRATNQIKVYEIRISDEWLNGFLSRYYTIQTSGYSKVGKGRGGDGRKSLYIILQRTRHILLSQNETKCQFTVDYLANVTELNVVDNKHRKLSLKRILDTFLQKGDIFFTYEFVRHDPTKLAQEKYWVELDFAMPEGMMQLREKRGTQTFYKQLIQDLRLAFVAKYPKVDIENEQDPFQRWLTNAAVDLTIKADVLIAIYFKAFNQNLTRLQAVSLIKEGLELP